MGVVCLCIINSNYLLREVGLRELVAGSSRQSLVQGGRGPGGGYGGPGGTCVKKRDQLLQHDALEIVRANFVTRSGRKL